METLINKNKIAVNTLVYVLFFFGGVIFFVSSETKSFAIFYYIILIIVIALVNPKLLIVQYIFFLPFSPLIATDNNIIGVIGIDEVSYLGMFLFMFAFKKSLFPKDNYYSYQKNAVMLIVFFVSFRLFFMIKDIIFSNSLHNFGYFFKYVFVEVMRYYPLVYIIKRLKSKEMQVLVLTAIFFSVISLFVTQVFSDNLYLLGFNYRKEELNISELVRFQGLYGGGGDVNSLGGFYVVVIGFILARINFFNKFNRAEIIIVIVSVFGLLLTASRTAIIALIVVLIIFFIRNFKSRIPYYLSVSIVLLFFVFPEFVNTQLSRFNEQTSYSYSDKESGGGRVGIWYIYTSFIADNPNTLVVGNTKTVKTDKSPHNIFIEIVYRSGGVFLFWLLLILFKIIKSYNSSHLNFFYFFIPVIIVWNSINIAWLGTYFLIFLALTPYVVSLNGDLKS